MGGPRKNPGVENPPKAVPCGQLKICRRIRQMLLNNYPSDGAPVDIIAELYESQYGEILDAVAFGCCTLEAWLRSPLLKPYVDVRKRANGPVYVKGKSYSSDPSEIVKKDKQEPGKGKNDTEQAGNGIIFNYFKRPHQTNATAAAGAAPADNTERDPNKTGEPQPDPKRARVVEGSNSQTGATRTGEQSTQVTPGTSSEASSVPIVPKCCHCLSNPAKATAEKVPPASAPSVKLTFALLEHPMEYYRTIQPPPSPPKEPQIGTILPTHLNAVVPFNPNGPGPGLIPPFNLTPPPCNTGHAQPLNLIPSPFPGPVPPPNVLIPSPLPLSSKDSMLIQILSSMQEVLDRLVSAQTSEITSDKNITPDKNQPGTETLIAKKRDKVHQNEEFVVEKEKLKASTTPLHLYHKSRGDLKHLPTRVGREEFLKNLWTCELTAYDLHPRQILAVQLLELHAKRHPCPDGIEIPVQRLVNPFVIHVNGLPWDFQWENVQDSFPLASIGVLEESINRYRVGKQFCNLLFWSTTDARTSFMRFVNRVKDTPLSNVHIDFGRFKNSNANRYRRHVRGF